MQRTVNNINDLALAFSKCSSFNIDVQIYIQGLSAAGSIHGCAVIQEINYDEQF
jgi:hypothetical protein